MIKTNELRIGNTVILSHEDDKEEYYNIKFINDSEYFPMFIKPVIINKEILIQFGFEYNNDTDSYILSWKEYYSNIYRNIEFKLEDDNHYCSFWIGNNADKLLLNIDYLHQLQNLYFVITGRELKRE